MIEIYKIMTGVYDQSGSTCLKDGILQPVELVYVDIATSYFDSGLNIIQPKKELIWIKNSSDMERSGGKCCQCQLNKQCQKQTRQVLIEPAPPI